ncbi:MAG: prepilin-type N-terminal cleavage/methylation domain-containing protein [Gemmatimonadaceae bacterium]
MRNGTKKGFTLIELLIVVVIIGILAAIAIPKFANTKEKAYIAAMKTDLRNLATAEEGYFADFQGYTSAPAALNGFQFSPSVTATVAATSKGWIATANHASTAVTCTTAVGNSVVSPWAEGQVHCA